MHDWFHRWAEAGVIEEIMRKAGHSVEQRGGFRLYECFVDATFSKARQGGDGGRPDGRCSRLEGAQHTLDSWLGDRDGLGPREPADIGALALRR